MKFDKFMEHCFKIICIVTAMFIFVGTVVSCSSRPVSAHAVEVSQTEQAEIQSFLDAYAGNLIALDFQLSSDADGNRNVRLQLFGTQQLAYKELLGIYGNIDFSVAPDSVSVSGSCSSGIYKSRLDSQLHYISGSGFNGFSGVLMSSDEFAVTLSFRTSEHQYTRLPSTFYNASSGLSFGVRPSGSCQLFYCILDCDTSYFNDYTYYVPGSMNENITMLWHISPDPYEDWMGSLPIQTLQDSSPFQGGYKVVAYSGTTTTLPNATIDTLHPWDYYNNYLLPDIINNYDIDNIEDYLVFPDGYVPEVEPTEPDYITPTNSKIYPIIIGVPLPIDIVDDVTGIVTDVLDVLADLLPSGGIQLNIDGVTFTFDNSSDTVNIDGKDYPIPLPSTEIKNHSIVIPDNVSFTFDGVPFTINPDNSITIDGTTYNLPIGTPQQMPSGYDNNVYQYQIPTMESLNIVDATLEPVDLSSFANGIGAFYGLGARLYYDLDLFPVLIVCLGLAGVGYAVSKLGGH